MLHIGPNNHQRKNTKPIVRIRRTWQKTCGQPSKSAEQEILDTFDVFDGEYLTNQTKDAGVLWCEDMNKIIKQAKNSPTGIKNYRIRNVEDRQIKILSDNTYPTTEKGIKQERITNLYCYL